MIPRKVLYRILAGGLLVASQARAVPTFDMTVRLLDRPLGSGPGGEFRFGVASSTVSGFSAGDEIKTFCLERWETVSITNPPKVYDVVINTKALWGGQYGVGDPLDPKTAYLYSGYCSGTLAGWTNDKDSADALQYAIYSIENEMTADLLTFSPAALSKANGFLAAAATANWTDIGNVRVMNLYYGYPTYYGCCGSPYYASAQDQLILLPPPIPAPPAVVLGLIGLGLVVQTNVRRFFR